MTATAAQERGVCSECGAHLNCTVGLATLSSFCTVCGGTEATPLEQRNPARVRRQFATVSLAEVDGMNANGYRAIVLDRLAKQAAEIVAADQSCIFVSDQDDPETTMVAAAHGAAEDEIGIRLAASAERSWDAHGPAATVELSWEGRHQGALSVSSQAVPREFSPKEMDVLRSLGTAAAAAIAHAHERPAGMADVRVPIKSLGATLADLDAYTAEHSRSVVDLACEVARDSGFAHAALAEVGVAALLHDIGKIRVPASIIQKPGTLTDEERAVMAQHPNLGADVLTRVPGLEVVATLVRYHHERWDGTGYPDGLTGARIPFASRIIAACDAYSAMTSDRPYRAAMPHEHALAELSREAGRQFDPDVVERVAAALTRRVAG
jgi:putative nucleotidyltransferase with HDIG domain